MTVRDQYSVNLPCLLFLSVDEINDTKPLLHIIILVLRFSISDSKPSLAFSESDWWVHYEHT